MSTNERIIENLKYMIAGKEQQANVLQSEINVLHSVKSNIETIIDDEARQQKKRQETA